MYKKSRKTLDAILFVDDNGYLLRFNLLDVLLLVLITKFSKAKNLYDKSFILHFFYTNPPFKFLYLFMVWSVIIHICRHDNLINSNTTTR